MANRNALEPVEAAELLPERISVQLQFVYQKWVGMKNTIPEPSFCSSAIKIDYSPFVIDDNESYLDNGYIIMEISMLLS